MRVRTKLPGCPLITRYVRTPKTRKRVSGNPTAGASPRRSLGNKAVALSEIFLLRRNVIFATRVIFVLRTSDISPTAKLRKKFAEANFNFIKSSIGITRSTSLIANFISMHYVRTNQSLGFSWEKLPPQRVMRGHPESFVRTCF